MTKPNSAPQAGGDETPVARVTLLTLQDGQKAKVLRALSEAWIVAVPDGTDLFTRPTPAAAAEVPTLTEAQLLEVFAKVDARCEQDATMLRIDAEGGYVDTLELLGARHGWRAFLRAARAVEAALASPVAPAGVPSQRETFEKWHSQKFGSALTEWVEAKGRYAWDLTQELWQTWQAAVLSAGAPAVPLQDSSSVHFAADGSSRALRAASRGQAVGDADSAPTEHEPPLSERRAHGVRGTSGDGNG